jgi:pimeloyl-ACP methyl ester carboxylesterase
MPLNLAVFGTDKANEIIKSNPQIRAWVIGGHSLGGAMASAYVYSNPGKVQGLVLWAAYPANNNNLSQSEIKVISMVGSQDGLATHVKITASHTLLPVDTTWIEIPGGNHAQMGWYGIQPGDGLATISREEQQARIVQETTNFLAQFAK